MSSTMANFLASHRFEVFDIWLVWLSLAKTMPSLQTSPTMIVIIRLLVRCPVSRIARKEVVARVIRRPRLASGNLAGPKSTNLR